MASYSALLVDYLTSQDENYHGYVGNGWVTVNSMLTAKNIAGTHGRDSWSPAPDEEFNGNTLACVLEYAAGYERGKYPTVQVGDDEH
eukprot:11500804-Heterocapsa_arctica.AAC.1